MKKLLYILSFAIFLQIFHTGCESNKGEIIPYVRVDIYEHLYSPPVVLLGNGESTIIKGGYRGIILYRESDLKYFAFDRTCTLWPNHDAAVIPDSVFAGDVYECPECASQYLLINEGQVSRGPAQYPLVRYNTVINGDILHIFN